MASAFWYWKIPEGFIKIIIISHPRDEQSKQCGWNTVISEMKNYAGIWYYFTKARADLSFRYDNKNVKSIAKVFRVLLLYEELILKSNIFPFSRENIYTFVFRIFCVYIFQQMQ